MIFKPCFALGDKVLYSKVLGLPFVGEIRLVINPGVDVFNYQKALEQNINFSNRQFKFMIETFHKRDKNWEFLPVYFVSPEKQFSACGELQPFVIEGNSVKVFVLLESDLLPLDAELLAYGK